ncbi:hypothetical protein [Xenorhabdus bharatensis]|uniref:hypothetical protein n=1 Tax=Xenorhabdus bharatensis TaxID=3136256 RepID=UPI0030F3BFDE
MSKFHPLHELTKERPRKPTTIAEVLKNAVAITSSIELTLFYPHLSPIPHNGISG